MQAKNTGPRPLLVGKCLMNTLRIIYGLTSNIVRCSQRMGYPTYSHVSSGGSLILRITGLLGILIRYSTDTMADSQMSFMSLATSLVAVNSDIH